MKEYFTKILHKIFKEDLEIRVCLFHLMAVLGAVICLIMSIVSISLDMKANGFFNIITGFVSTGLLIYSVRSRRYRFCYTVSIIIVFFLLFPGIFLSGGGYSGGMPFFFVFAIVYTAYMMDGWHMVLVTFLEIILYSGLCIYGYCFPENIYTFKSDVATFIDFITGFLTVSLVLGGSLFVQFYLYKKQQKELEEAREDAITANNAKSAFLANMSHEIRTPIHIILGMNEIIRRENRTYQVQQCSEKIDDAGKMLISLIDNVLDVSKIESGKMEFLPQKYKTKELTNTLLLIGKSKCDKKGLHFYMDVQENIPQELIGDIAHIKQIVSNLLSNAAKYTNKGGVRVKITYQKGKQDGEIFLNIMVRDTGIGIRSEAIPGLFEAFKREDLASHRYIEGTGLGLAIVMNLTKLMGGKIKVESEYGEGSSFYVQLPQKTVQESEKETEKSIKKFRAPEGKILVVDDNEANRIVMKSLLEDIEIQADMAESGIQCIDMVKKKSYHLILMDYMMEGMNGAETFEELKKIPGFHVPVIILTANAMLDMKDDMKKLGVSAFITKPVPWAELEKAILSAIPKELITISVEKEKTNEKKEVERLKDLLFPYGIILEKALFYFNGDIDKCGKTAKMFMKYNEDDFNKAKEMEKKEDYVSLKFIVHSLKGKSKNMGMERLSKTAERLEELCTEGKNEEVKSLMPYLFYLWNEAGKGMEVLIKEVDIKDREVTDVEKDMTVQKCEELLPDLLSQLRRKPSLSCLNVLISEEENEEGKTLLKETEDAVHLISFDKAENIFQDYLKWKRSKNNGL